MDFLQGFSAHVNSSFGSPSLQERIKGLRVARRYLHESEERKVKELMSRWLSKFGFAGSSIILGCRKVDGVVHVIDGQKAFFSAVRT